MMVKSTTVPIYLVESVTPYTGGFALVAARNLEEARKFAEAEYPFYRLCFEELEHSGYDCSSQPKIPTFVAGNRIHNDY